MARYGKEHKEITRQKILDEAERIISAQGPDAVVIDALMKSLGLTHGGFYAHFPSRDALLAEAVKRMCDGVLDMLLRKLEGHDGIDGLIAYFENYLSQRHLTAHLRLCPVSSLSAFVPQLSEVIRQRYTLAYVELTDKIAAILAKAKVKEPKNHAIALLAQVSGAFTIAKALGPSAIADNLLKAALTDVTTKARSLAANR